jgi:hypothetical protein
MRLLLKNLKLYSNQLKKKPKRLLTPEKLHKMLLKKSI